MNIVIAIAVKRGRNLFFGADTSVLGVARRSLACPTPENFVKLKNKNSKYH
jgi:hypothetical protein